MLASRRLGLGVWRCAVGEGLLGGGRGELGAAGIGAFEVLSRRFRRAPRSTRRSVHDKLRRQKWREVRAALEYASRFDERGSTLESLRRTMLRLQWPVVREQQIAQGLEMPLALQDRYLCFDVATKEDYVPNTTILTPEVLTKHALVRRKGWKLVVVNARAWERAGMKAADAGGGPFEARVELLSRLLVRQAPFAERRVVGSRS